MKRVIPSEAAERLLQGEVALVPTETVVGLVANDDGLEKVFRIKGRDSDKPVALLCRDADEAFSLASEVPDVARVLAEEFWPGPLTLVLKSRDVGTVGVRVPLGIVREVLDAYGKPLYATSANISGEPAPDSIQSVDRRVMDVVDVIVEGEPGGGEASAVVDLSGDEPRIIRASERLDEQSLSEIIGGATR